MEGISTMQLLTIKELMSFLKVKRNTVYELRRKGLPVIHLGRSVRFERDEIIKWVRSNCSVNTQPVSEQKTSKAAKVPQATAIAGSLALVPIQSQSGSDFLL